MIVAAVVVAWVVILSIAMMATSARRMAVMWRMGASIIPTQKVVLTETLARQGMPAPAGRVSRGRLSIVMTGIPVPMMDVMSPTVVSTTPMAMAATTVPSARLEMVVRRAHASVC